MRCKKCGKLLPLLTKFCQKCGQQVDPEQKRKAWNYYTIFLVVAFSISNLLIFLINRNTATNATENRFFVALTAALGVIGGFAALQLPIILIVKLYKSFIALIKLCFKKPKFIPVPIIIFLVIAGGGYLVYDKVSDFTYGIFVSETRVNPVPLIKDSLTEATAVKIIGDMLDMGLRSNYSWKNIENTATAIATAAANIPVRSTFADYKKVATIWPGRIREQINDTKNWKSLSNAPADFAISLSSSKAKRYLEETVEKLSLLKEFGDDAIKRKDKEAMRYIDAKLLVEEHWLNGVIYSKNNYFAQLIAPVYAYSGDARKICYQIDKKDVCADNIKSIIVDIEKAANDYVYGKDKAVEGWNNVWDMAIKERGLFMLASASSTEYSPTVQIFIDDCYAKGGSLTDVKKDTDRLPTNEAGYTCGYKVNDLNCWNFLTYSGGQYSGGDDKCSERNLLPKDIVYKKEQLKVNAQTAQPQAKSKITTQTMMWDGDYRVVGTLVCAGAIPGMGSLPVDVVVEVKNNMMNGNVPINSQGKVSFSINQTQTIDGVPITMAGKTSYQFFKDGNTLKASGNSSVVVSGTAMGETRSSTCEGSVNGIKQ